MIFFFTGHAINLGQINKEKILKYENVMPMHIDIRTYTDCYIKLKQIFEYILCVYGSKDIFLKWKSIIVLLLFLKTIVVDYLLHTLCINILTIYFTNILFNISLEILSSFRHLLSWNYFRKFHSINEI